MWYASTLRQLPGGFHLELESILHFSCQTPLSTLSLSVCEQISEKQKSLYEALERQQHYQESLQSISTKMESVEAALSEGLEPSKTPESQMAAHQVRRGVEAGFRDALELMSHDRTPSPGGAKMSLCNGCAKAPSLYQLLRLVSLFPPPGSDG